MEVVPGYKILRLNSNKKEFVLEKCDENYFFNQNFISKGLIFIYLNEQL